MNKIVLFFSVIIICLFNACEAGLQSSELTLQTRQDSLSYAYGVMSINGEGGMKKLGIKINADEYQKGYDYVVNEIGEFDLQELIKPLQAMSQEIAQREGKQFTEDDQPFTDVDEFSYAFGAYNASSYVSCGYQVNGNAMCMGMRDAYLDAEKITEDQLTTMAQEFGAGLRTAQMAEVSKAGELNLAKGAAFLADNKAKDGVKETASGLQYKVIKAGTGSQSPAATSTVTVMYEGRLIDGKVFDGNIQGGDPLVYQVNRFIPGWTEALQLMTVGDKWQLYIPAHLAYGERGAGGDIGANETLIFDIELLEFK